MIAKRRENVYSFGCAAATSSSASLVYGSVEQREHLFTDKLSISKVHRFRSRISAPERIQIPLNEQRVRAPFCLSIFIAGFVGIKRIF